MAAEAAETKALWDEMEAFYRREADLLQRADYEQWVNTLFTEDLHYHMPVVSVRETRDEAVRGEGELSYFDETHEVLALRVRKLGSEMAWTEYPPSRVRYFFQLMAVEPLEDGEVLVRSNFILYQTRLENVEHFFVGEKIDRMRRVDGEWKVAKRRIVVDRSRLNAENLSVFF